MQVSSNTFNGKDSKIMPITTSAELPVSYMDQAAFNELQQKLHAVSTHTSTITKRAYSRYDPEYGAGKISVALGVLAAAVGSGWLDSRLHAQLEQLPTGKAKEERARIKALLEAAKLPANIPVLKDPGSENAAYYAPGNLEFVSPKYEEPNKQYGSILYDPKFGKPGILAHEMGHATIQNSPWYSPSRFNQRWLRPAGDIAGIFTPAIGAITGLKTKNPLIGAGVGGALGLLTGAPTLINEYQASHRAGKYLRGANESHEVQQANKKLLNSAFHTYLNAALIPGTVAGGAGGLMGMAIKNAVTNYSKLDQQWAQVPQQVSLLIKTAGDVKKQVQKAILNLDVADKGYGQVYWHPKKNNLWLVLSDSDSTDTYDKWWAALSAIPSINKVFVESEVGPPADSVDEWVRIKRGSSTLNPFTLAGKPFGGPTALTNGIVGALIGGGVGYGGGRLAEMFLPARHFDDEHRLSRTLGMAGAAIGGMPGVVQGFTNAGMNADAGDPSWSRSFMEPTHKQKVAPNELNWYKHVMGKYANDNGSLTGVMSGLPPVRVDRFNNVIWQDPYSTPAINAAAAGIVSGISQQYGGAKLLTPKHFIRGLAAAGVDYATATVAGGILGTLGGLKPEAQKTLQDMGLWSGLIRGSIGSILGQ